MHAKLDLDYLILEAVDRWCPAATDLAFWARGLLLLPIDHKILCREPSSFFSLPMVVTARRADQSDPVLLFALDQ